MLSRILNLPPVPLLARWKSHIAELALILACYFVYLLTRGLLFPDLDQTALQNSLRVVTAESSIGVYWEPGWQAWAVRHAPALVIAMNWVYIVTYWPIVLCAGLLLYIRNRPWFYYYRTVVLISLVIALLIFMFFPVASPFKITTDFVDTMQTFGPSFYGSPEMAVYYNTNAAMPSLHFGWTVILGALFFRSLRGWLKALGLAYPALTFLAITITGNHFILDAAAGGLLAGAAFGIMEMARRLRALQARPR